MPYGFNDDKSKFNLSDIASLLSNSDRDTLRNIIAYKAGDTISGSCRAIGYVTNSSKNIKFTIPLTLPIASGVNNIQMGNSVQIEGPFATWSVRQDGNYLFGSPDGNEELLTGRCSCHTSSSGVNVEYAQSSAISNAANNTEVAIQITYYLILS